MRFQRRQIEVLVAVQQHGSIHRAAQQLGVAQPVVSRMLAAMEGEIGTRLFDRSAQGCVPTAASKALLANAKVLLRALERMDADAAGEARSVRFGCIPRAMHTLMPLVIARMRSPEQAWPSACRLEVIENDSTGLLDAIQRCELDFAVMRHVAGPAGIGQALDVQRLYEERPLVVAGVRHPLARSKRLQLSSLVGQAWSLPGAETTTRAVLDRYCMEQGLGVIRPVLETRSFDSSVAVVAGSDLLALVPETVARRYERAGMVRVLPVTPPLPSTPVLLVADPRSSDDPTLSEFRNLIVRAAQEMSQLTISRNESRG